MKYFLELVAEDLYQRFGHDLSHTLVLFPNKRASLFLNDYLGRLAKAPLWAPRYLSISDLFTSLSDKTVADPIESVCRLYKRYVDCTGNNERLDYFYGWGERLLADFDDVDKNMADPAKLFRDLRDYEALSDNGFLDEEQLEQLHKLSADFSDEKLTDIQKRFDKLWGSMPALYNGLRNDLAAEGKAYEGQLYREVAEGLTDGSLQWPAQYKHVAIVGFNVIDRVEHTLFSFLKKQGVALFYWDYDTYYAQPQGGRNNPAGLFMQQNMQDFPNALPEACFDNFSKQRGERTIEVARSATELAQAQSVNTWLSSPEYFNPKQARRTAVVMCNEALLQPILHALPEDVGDVNVTKGFPLGQTPAFACVTRFFKNLEQEHDEAVSTHNKPQPWAEGEACLPVLSRLLDELKKNYRDTIALTSPDDLLNQLYTESYFQAYTLTNRFTHFVASGLLDVQLPTLFKLLRAVMRNTSIPFHGEPAVGLQVMGVLETRCLDFDNVLLLSVGEGVLPQRSNDASFIPFLLRKMYGLTTPDRQVSVYAYYFYRLLQRAHHVRICYNESTEGMQRGEMSRFVRALLVERDPKLDVHHVVLEAAHQPTQPLQPHPAYADEAYYKKLEKGGLSPSALKSYFKCQLQFYYHYVLGLRTPQVNDGIINANDFGTVVHKVAEDIYVKELKGKESKLTPQLIATYVADMKEHHLDELIIKAFDEVNHDPKRKDLPPIPYSRIAHHAVRQYVQKLLEFEGNCLRNAKAPATEFSQVEGEGKKEMYLSVPCGDRTVNFKLYGYIDRLDKCVIRDHPGVPCQRIIDYKTGRRGDRDKIKDLDALFNDGNNFPENALQVLIYSLMFVDYGKPVVPMLYYIPSMPNKDFTPYICINKEPITDFRTIAPEFRERLIARLSELLDPNRPFVPTKVTSHCDYCDYRLLCGKTEEPYKP